MLMGLDYMYSNSKNNNNEHDINTTLLKSRGFRIRIIPEFPNN